MLTFSTLTASDANKINNINNQLEPYSDFNFISLYSWSLHSQTKFAVENDCLFLILPDYITHRPNYTFICKGNELENLSIFTSWLRTNSIQPKFSLLPEPVAIKIVSYLQKSEINFHMFADRDAYDYVLETEKLAAAEGKKYEDIRYKTALFDRTFASEIQISEFDPSSRKNQLKAIQLAEIWASKKASKAAVYQDEIDAFNRFLQISRDNPRVFFKAYTSGDNLIALASYELISKHYAMGHFLKFNYEYKGIYYKLVRDICTDLANKGVNYINIEQDLGITGLRKTKLSLRPTHFQKKYTLEIIGQN